MSRILVVEDESAIAELISINLRHAGFEVTIAATAEQAQAAVDGALPDLIVLDWMLPGQSGLALAKRWRGESRTRELPVIMLTARADEADKIQGLDAGADDYLTKPFGIAELNARIRVALRHASRSPSSADAVYVAVAGGRTLKIDTEARTVRVSEGSTHRDIRLTPTEFKLLAFFVKHAGKVLTHQHILREVWGPTHTGDVQYLRVYAGQLRQKLEADPAQPRFLVTEPGVGYRLPPSNETLNPA